MASLVQLSIVTEISQLHWYLWRRCPGVALTGVQRKEEVDQQCWYPWEWNQASRTRGEPLYSLMCRHTYHYTLVCVRIHTCRYTCNGAWASTATFMVHHSGLVYWTSVTSLYYVLEVNFSASEGRASANLFGHLLTSSNKEVFYPPEKWAAAFITLKRSLVFTFLPLPIICECTYNVRTLYIVHIEQF